MPLDKMPKLSFIQSYILGFYQDSVQEMTMWGVGEDTDINVSKTNLNVIITKEA